MRYAFIALGLMCSALLACDGQPDGDDPDVPDGPCGHPASACAEDADCGEGTCVELVADSNLCLCQQAAPRNPVECFDGEPWAGNCCADDECGEGQYCAGAGYNARGQYCNGIPPAGGACAEVPAGCDGHDDCAEDRLCVLGGMLGYLRNTCVPAPCATDADCGDGPDGRCSYLAIRCGQAGFACTYADDVCRSNADCENGGSCVRGQDGRTECRMYEPAP